MRNKMYVIGAIAAVVVAFATGHERVGNSLLIIYALFGTCEVVSGFFYEMTGVG